MDPAVLEKALNSMNSLKVKERLKKYTDEALDYEVCSLIIVLLFVLFYVLLIYILTLLTTNCYYSRTRL